MSEQILTQSDRLQDACTRLTDAESTIKFVCKQVIENNMTPEMALLTIHADTLPTIVRAYNGVVRVKDEIREAEKHKEDDQDAYRPKP